MTAITARELEEIIQVAYEVDHLDNKSLAKYVVTFLNKKSSKFKYIVTINRIEAHDSSKNNISSNIQNFLRGKKH